MTKCVDADLLSIASLCMAGAAVFLGVMFHKNTKKLDEVKTLKRVDQERPNNKSDHPEQGV